MREPHMEPDVSTDTATHSCRREEERVTLLFFLSAVLTENWSFTTGLLADFLLLLEAAGPSG